MSKLALFGIIGGALIAVSAFLSGDDFTFDSGALDDTTLLVLFIAGLAVIVFTLVRMKSLAAYAAGAATGLFLVDAIAMIRAEEFEFTVRIVVLLVGVVLALLATLPTGKIKVGE